MKKFTFDDELGGTRSLKPLFKNPAHARSSALSDPKQSLRGSTSDQLIVEATTIVETCCAMEDEVFHVLLQQFHMESNLIRFQKLQIDLMRLERESRKELHVEEQCETTKLAMARDLLRYDRRFVPMDQVYQAIHIKPKGPKDESWRKLPQLLRDVEPVTLQPTAVLLNTPAGLELQVARLLTVENDDRQKIMSDAHQQLLRSQRNFNIYLSQLQDVEANIARDVELVIIGRLDGVERWKYVSKPIVNGETRQRMLIALEQNCDRRRLQVECEELVGRQKMLERQHSQQREIRASELHVKFLYLQKRTFLVCAGKRFTLWKKITLQNVKRRCAQVGLDLMEIRLAQSLLRRYCEKWNRGIHNRRVLREQLEFFSLQHHQYVHILVTEEEERDRNTIIIERSSSIAELGEKFLSEGDIIVRGEQTMAAEELLALNKLRLMMFRLTRWYRFWRLNPLRKRASFLEETALTRLRKRYYDKFCLFAQQKKKCLEVSRMFLPLVETIGHLLLVQNQEEISRVRIEWQRSIEHEPLKILHEKTNHDDLRRHQLERVSFMEHKMQKKLLRRYYGLWVSSGLFWWKNFVLKNENILRLRFWKKWDKYRVLFGPPRMELLERATSGMEYKSLCVEEDEDRARLHLDFRAFRGYLLLSKHLQSRLFHFRPGPNTVLSLEKKSNLRALRLKFQFWKRRAHFHAAYSFNVGALQSIQRRAAIVLCRSVWDGWFSHAHLLRSQRNFVLAQGKERLGLQQHENEQRIGIRQDENAMFMTSVQKFEVHREHILLRQKVSMLEQKNRLIFSRRTLYRWRTWLARQKRRRTNVEILKQSSNARRMRYAFNKLTLHLRSVKLLRVVEAMGRANQLKLARRYFLKLNPLELRTFRISRAKLNLERAKVMARVLFPDAPTSPEAVQKREARILGRLLLAPPTFQQEVRHRKTKS